MRRAGRRIAIRWCHVGLLIDKIGCERVKCGYGKSSSRKSRSTFRYVWLVFFPNSITRSQALVSGLLANDHTIPAVALSSVHIVISSALDIYSKTASAPLGPISDTPKHKSRSRLPRAYRREIIVHRNGSVKIGMSSRWCSG